LLCLPLVFKGDLLGGILAGVAADGPAPDLALADALASQAAAALANAGLFETLRQKEGELRKLSHLRAQAQEESLRAMSRELHDGFGQVLTVVSMDLGMLERARDLDAPTLRARLREVRDQISRLMQDVRTMSQVLRPPMLDFGLVPTLHWFVEKFTESSEIEVRLRTPPEETRLPPPIELLLYRVAQEALTNVAKHARARHVDVELAVRDARVTLSVADDGVGFEVDRFRRTPSLARPRRRDRARRPAAAADAGRGPARGVGGRGRLQLRAGVYARRPGAHGDRRYRRGAHGDARTPALPLARRRDHRRAGRDRR